MSASLILDWGLQTGLAVGLLIGFVLLIRRPFAKIFGAKAAYTLWALPFIRLVLPQITVPRLFPQAASSAPPTPEFLYLSGLEPTAATPDWTALITPALLTIWLVGAAAFFLLSWLRHASLADKMVYQSVPAPAHLSGSIKAALRMSGLKRRPHIRLSDGGDGPLVTGFLRPVVILPHNFETSLTAPQQRYALIHEFTHLRRGDLWVALAWLIFRALNWPNPLVHYAMRYFRSDQEAACDASVLGAMGGSRAAIADYAETLVQAAKAAARRGETPKQAALALTIHHPLKERLMILGTQRKTSGWMSRTAAAALIMGVAAMTAPLTVASDHPDEELAGKHDIRKSKSVIKFESDDDGKVVSKHYEISIDDDKVEAFEIDNAGRKTAINANEIEGFDLEAMKGGQAWSFGLGGEHKLKMMSRGGFAKWRDGDFKEWKEGDFKDWKEGDFKKWAEENKGHRILFLGKDGENRFEFPHAPNPPFPPGLGSKGQPQFFMSDGGEVDIESFALRSRLQSAESLLEAAEALIKQAEEKGTESRKVSKAKRELEKARRALKDAERALKDE